MMKPTIPTSCKRIILVGPSDFSKNLTKVEENDFVIFVDGGVRHFTKLSPKSHISIGDGDSLDRPASPPLDIELPQEKNRSDLLHALNLIGDRNQEVLLYGFEGGRIDHFLFVLGELNLFLQGKKNINKVVLESITLFNKGEHFLDLDGIFSLGSLSQQKISLKGAIKYSGEYELKCLSSQGLSNIALGEFSLTCQKPLFLFFPVKPQNEPQ